MVSSEIRTYLDNDGMPIPGALAVKFDKPAEDVSPDRCCQFGCENSEDGNPIRDYLGACASSERVEEDPTYEGVNIEFCVETTKISSKYYFEDGSLACEPFIEQVRSSEFEDVDLINCCEIDVIESFEDI